MDDDCGIPLFQETPKVTAEEWNIWKHQTFISFPWFTRIIVKSSAGGSTSNLAPLSQALRRNSGKRISTRVLLGTCVPKPSETASKTWLISARQHFYAKFSLISSRVNCISYLLIGFQMLGPSFNTLLTNHMYSCQTREKFWQQVPTQFSLKPKIFSQNFVAFLKSA